MLERDKAENFGPSGRLVVGGFEFIVSAGTITSAGFTSTFGSATSAFCKLLPDDCVLLSAICLASTIE